MTKFCISILVGCRHSIPIQRYTFIISCTQKTYCAFGSLIGFYVISAIAYLELRSNTVRSNIISTSLCDHARPVSPNTLISREHLQQKSFSTCCFLQLPLSSFDVVAFLSIGSSQLDSAKTLYLIIGKNLNLLHKTVPSVIMVSADQLPLN